MSNDHRTIKVDVFDHAANRINGACVNLTSVPGGEVYRLTLDSGLVCYAGDVPSGHYILSAQAPGCAGDQRAVEIHARDTRSIVMLGPPGMAFYYRGDVKVPFQRRDDLVAVAFDPGSADQQSRLDELARKLGLSEVAVDGRVKEQGIHVLRFSRNATPNDWLVATKELTEEIGVAGPLLRWRDDNTGVAFLTDEFVVRFHRNVDSEKVFQIEQEFGLQRRRQFIQAANTYLYRVPGVACYDTLAIAEQLVERELVVYAEPNLISAASVADATEPANFLFRAQWHLPLIDCPRAWQLLHNHLGSDFAMGCPNVTIAIVDWGIDVDNPDLTGTVSNKAPKLCEMFDFQNMVANNANRTRGHGTCCAGVATAQAGKKGVCGVAGNCRFMAIRRPEGAAGTETAYADMYLWIAGFDPESDRDGFPRPICRGADVISNSFSYGVGAPISGLMSDTFRYLTTHGRGGLGTLLFFSAGNHMPPEDFTLARPWAASDRTIAVTASSLASDGLSEIRACESNFGGGATPIDVCAPSASRLGAPYDLPNSYAIVTSADHTFADPDPYLQPNAPSSSVIGTTTSEPVAAAIEPTKVVRLAVESTAGFGTNQFVVLGALGTKDMGVHTNQAGS
jgi:Subtilase family